MSHNKFFENYKPLFPEYKTTNSCALVGMARTTRSDAPYNNPDWGMWALNETASFDWYKQEKTSMWFQLHPIWDIQRVYNRNDMNHWNWLHQKHDFPIMMQAEFRNIPSAVRYPIEEAIDAFGQYLTSSPAYMLALAILMGYERIGIWGVEMSADSEYIYQKAGFEYLIGFARGLGIDIYLPPECELLRGNLYAYEDLRASARSYFQAREATLSASSTVARDKLWATQGEMNGLMTIMQDPDVPHADIIKPWLSERVVDQETKVNEMQREYGKAAGALGEIQHLINWFDLQNCANDRKENPDE